jgi:hypothetical protein
MASIIRTDALQNLNTSNIITQTNATTITVGASGQTISIPAGATLVNSGTASGFGLTWQSVQTTGFTAVKGNAYPCNTTSASFTVTLPATPSAGDQVQLVDYAGTFDTNALTISPNGNKIESGTSNLLLTGEREGVILTYIDSTQGWIATSGINEGTDALEPTTYSADFLVIAGGGGGGGGKDDGFGAGGGGAGGYRNSYSTEPSGGGGPSEASLTLDKGIVYTITVGAGGAGATNANGVVGSDSSISGTGITTITSSGGGFGKGNTGGTAGAGGSGGGNISSGGGLGTANQGFNGGSGSPGQGIGGGGGGAGAVGVDASASGGNGGAGVASSITGSSVTRAGGGGAGAGDSTGAGTGGSGGGGNGANASGTATVGTINTGSGGGAEGGGTAGSGNHGVGRAGGKGVVILRMPTARYSGTTTGSPTVGTDGTDTILTFNDSGSYTG